MRKYNEPFSYERTRQLEEKKLRKQAAAQNANAALDANPEIRKANGEAQKGKLIPGAAPLARNYTSGIFSEELRQRLRPVVLNGVVLLEKILTGQSPTEGNPDPTANEIIAAWKSLAPYVTSELKPVMDETICRVVAEVLSEDDRIPFECIGDAVSKLISRLENA